MEGRPARLHAETGEYRARIDGLVRADRGAQFRDATIGTATAILVVATIALAVAAGCGSASRAAPASPSCSRGLPSRCSGS